MGHLNEACEFRMRGRAASGQDLNFGRLAFRGTVSNKNTIYHF